MPCGKPFPRRCPECGKVEVQPATIAYDAEVKHDGRVYTFNIPQLRVNQCGACGEVLFGNVTDDQISQALREHLSLLSPEQIRGALGALGLKQKDLGQRIGVAPETISRWISGTHIQSRAMDNLMRLFFAFDNVRSALTASAPDRKLGLIAPAPAGAVGLPASNTSGKPSGSERLGKDRDESALRR
jgi:putative zinc finger/helix-turn-helix YgiT family protein